MTSHSPIRLRFLVTAGPTREPVDPVRYLSNRSSGRMGFAIAAAASAAGHSVTLVSGPTALRVPEGVGFAAVESAADMLGAVAARIGNADVCIMAAAVADYRPARVAPQKLKKSAPALTLELERTGDILGSARGPMGFGGLLVGFAAETEDLEASARAKLASKGCDLVAANEVGRPGTGFDSLENELVLFHRDGRTEPLGLHSKDHLGTLIVEVCEREWRARQAPAAAQR